ncbi:MAG: UTRA domain-containing protein, partial [Caldilineaceae bacterium]|nr:UTRA domain-containing protein [Caldilineaceae bacterium]
EESVEAVLLSTDEADIFGVPSGSPALLSRRITRDVNDMAIEVSMSLYRGDLYRMALIRRR